MSFTYIGFNDENIICFEYEGQKIINPFEVAVQAMLGAAASLPYQNENTSNLIPRYFPLRYLTNNADDSYAKAAISWLLQHAVHDGEACYWEYDYEICYHGEKIAKPWRSAYGQAYAVLALLHWYMLTGEAVYSDYIKMGIKGLVTTQSNHGIVAEKADGFFWFEEIPGHSSTHILNAHLVAFLSLLEVNKVLPQKDYSIIIKQVLHCLENNILDYDSGINSIYELYPVINKVVQLRYQDSSKHIFVKKLVVYDGDRKIKEISCADARAFDSKQDVYISGIDWGKANTDGSREILDGYVLRQDKVLGGDRHNVYICFHDLRLTSPFLRIELECREQGEGTLGMYVYAENGELFPLGGGDNYISIQQGKGSLVIRRQSLADMLSQVYHKYHIQLLEEINNVVHSDILHQMIHLFREYSQSWQSQTVFPQNWDQRCLEYLFVSVNTKCGLHCKMCDVGMDNKEASLYQNLSGQEENISFDDDLFLQRCHEIDDMLKTVHFIGTEPTLYQNLPVLIKRLKQAGKRVLVTTNGIILQDSLPCLLDADVDEIWISIDGVSLVHDEIRGKEGLYDGIIKAIMLNKEKIEQQNMRGLGQINISCAITPLNYDKLLGLAKAMTKLPIKCVSFTHMNFITAEVAAENNAKAAYKIGASCISPEVAPSLINPVVLYQQIHKISSMESKVKFFFAPSFMAYPDIEDFYLREGYNTLKRVCTTMNHSLQLNCDGSVCIMSRCYKLSLGNIHKQNFREIFFGYPLKAFAMYLYRNGLAEPCYHCCALM